MSRKAQHGLATIDNRVYNWGGNCTGTMPIVHSSPLKDSLTSTVEVFDMESLSWNSVATIGIPPAAVMQYSCCSLGSKMYTFGGSCKPSDCYHNDLFALDTLNKEWRQVNCIVTKSPMKKQGAGMVSFTSNNDEHLFVFGGFGPNPTPIPSDGQYIRSPYYPDKSFTNEMHMLTVPSSTGWIVPVVTGTTPPPTAYCTLDILPSQDKAILFGGVVVDGRSIVNSSNSVYILALKKNQVHCQKLHCSNSPKGRQGHCSAVVTINGSAYLIVGGGMSGEGGVTNDLWMLNIEAKQWKKITVPESVCKRINHAAVSVKVTHNRVWIIVNGGFNANYQPDGNADFVTGANVTVVVELVYSNRDWSVVNVWNSEQLKKNRSQIHRQLVQHLIDQNYDKGTLYELITIMQSPTKGLNDNAQLRLVQQLHQEQKEQNMKLQSDVTLSRVALLYKIHQEQNQSRELAEDESREESSKQHVEDLKKMLRGQTMELEKLRKEVFNEGGDKESLTDKQAILKEDCEALKKNEDGKAKDLKDQYTQFNYMIIVNDCLDNVHVGGETAYLIQGSNAQSLNWTAWGLEMHFSKDTLSPNETCEVAVKALVGGDFKFPPDCELISAVYAVSFTTKVKKAVKVDMQHCAVLKEEGQFQYLSFVMAPMRQRVPPFEFSNVEGGQFHLEIMVKNTIYVFTQPPSESQQTKEESEAETALPNVVQNESVAVPQPPVEMSYSGQMLYANDGVNRKWLVKFMAVKDLSALHSFIKEKHSNEEAGQPLRFGFDEDGRVLELIMDHPQDKSFTGWEVLPDVEPLTILREDIDRFGQDKGPPAPPYCQITVFLTPSSDSVPFINYCVPLKGVTSATKMLFIKCFPPTLEQGGTQQFSTQKQEPQGKTPEALPDVSRVIASIKEEMNKKFAGLKSIFDNSIDVVTAEMFAAGLISSEVKSRQSAEAVITDFQSGFEFMNSLPEIKQHCSMFFDVLEKMGGPFRIASNSLKQSIKKNVEDKCNTTFRSF